MSMESNIVLLEMDRRAMVDRLQKEVDQEKGKADAARERIRMLDEEITRAKAAMRRFRQEFEQLRVALLIDRMAKSTQVAGLAERRRRLAKDAEEFQKAVEDAKQRVAQEQAKYVASS